MNKNISVQLFLMPRLCNHSCIHYFCVHKYFIWNQKMFFIFKEIKLFLYLQKEQRVFNSTDWAKQCVHPPNLNLNGFLKHDRFFLTSFQSESIQPFTGCEVVKAALSLCRFWLQFSTEDGPGPGSAISLDNISFSMDCFLACEYHKDVESVFFSLLLYQTLVELMELFHRLPEWLAMTRTMGGKKTIKLMINTGLPYVHV